MPLRCSSGFIIRHLRRERVAIHLYNVFCIAIVIGSTSISRLISWFNTLSDNMYRTGERRNLFSVVRILARRCCNSTRFRDDTRYSIRITHCRHLSHSESPSPTNITSQRLKLPPSSMSPIVTLVSRTLSPKW